MKQLLSTGFQNRWLRKLVTSSTWSPTMTQQSLSVLCLATSSALTDMLTRVGCGKSGHQNRATNLLSQDDQNESGIAGSEGTPACFTLGTATQNISESTGRHLQGTHGTLRVLCQWTQYSLMFRTGLCDVHNFRTPSTARTNPCRTRYRSVTNKYYCENTIV